MAYLSRDSLKKCTKCSWTGRNSKWSLCHMCGKTYHRCPICGARTEPLLARIGKGALWRSREELRFNSCANRYIAGLLNKGDIFFTIRTREKSLGRGAGAAEK